MTDYLEMSALINGILNTDPQTKGNFGRRCAIHLGLEPGPAGKDGGIDGVGYWDERKIYFQSKLERNPLDAQIADYLYANLVRHRAEVGVLLAGVGYTKGFEPRLKEFYDIERFKIHLLSLHDYFNETPAFEKATKDLPTLRDLGFENVMLRLK